MGIYTEILIANFPLFDCVLLGTSTTSIAPRIWGYFYGGSGSCSASQYWAVLASGTIIRLLVKILTLDANVSVTKTVF